MIVAVIVSLFLNMDAALVAALAPPQPPSKQKMDSPRRAFLTGTIILASSGAATTFLVQPPPQPAHAAYEVRVIGGDKPSATMAAFNLQIQQTTARLEKDGFPLDSREDEAKRLSEAMASFSYSDSIVGSSSSKNMSTKSSTPSKRNANSNDTTK
jgi:hypothetical protein